MLESVQSPKHSENESSDQDQALSFKERLWAIIFEAETPSGKFFDVALLWVIIISVTAVILESIEEVNALYHTQLVIVEWFCTIIFSIEYLLRVWLVRRPKKYIFSFFGLVDLLSCLPSYLALISTGGSHFIVIRIIRLLRMFRVLKMISHVRGANTILSGLAASRAKITVFFFSVLIFAMLAGTLIYIVESGVEGSQFTSIPVGIYYAIVSITTVGYGDITAVTPLGKLLTSMMVLGGYAIIAVPTGIVASDMVREALRDETTDACPGCGVHGHLADAKYCRKCGEELSG